MQSTISCCISIWCFHGSPCRKDVGTCHHRRDSRDAGAAAWAECQQALLQSAVTAVHPGQRHLLASVLCGLFRLYLTPWFMCLSTLHPKHCNLMGELERIWRMSLLPSGLGTSFYHVLAGAPVLASAARSWKHWGSFCGPQRWLLHSRRCRRCHTCQSCSGRRWL